MQHVFIVGSKGIPASYGGYETFVDKLTENQVSSEIKYHVACAVDKMPDQTEFEYNGAHCFNIKWRPYGAAKAIFFDTDALDWCIRYIKENDIQKPLVYVLACRIGPFFAKYVKRIHALGGKVFVNPDGHEWMRGKWSAPVRRYWKVSERLMVKHADLLVCDSKNIEKYIQTEYAKFRPNTTYIAYGADIAKSTLPDDSPVFIEWLSQKGLQPYGYYLVVGRFVPENNYETMIREFMASDSKKDFALITGVNDAFLDKLQHVTGFKDDPRVKFVGTVYDQDLLKKIRENAFAYFHGHEVGGTNPSLLEALSSTRLNLLLDVGFNSEVAENSAIYWKKGIGSLSALIQRVEQLKEEDFCYYDQMSTRVVQERFSWSLITELYETLFLS